MVCGVNKKINLQLFVIFPHVQWKGQAFFFKQEMQFYYIL